MNTVYLRLNSESQDQQMIQKAADILLSGELVAFPTETVYGLGACAFCQEAVDRIFQVKQRPYDSPLLVHISKKEHVARIAREISPEAQLLMDKFWPGPLSIIVAARPEVPDVVRGGKDRIGLRMPSHPVALALIDITGPLAAPSANLHGRPSPVSADHVRDDLDGKIAAVLDAGPVGPSLESTIIDLSVRPFQVLRLGAIPVEEVQEVLKEGITVKENNNIKYQFNIKSYISRNIEDFNREIQEQQAMGKKIAVVYNNANKQHNMNSGSIREYELDLMGRNASIYSILRDAEQSGMDIIIFAPWPENLSGVARSMADRVYRAAGRE